MGLAKTEKNRHMLGLAASPGIAIGLARVTDRSRVAVAETSIEPDEVAAEVARYREALARTRSDLVQLKNQLAAERGHEHLYVIDTHLMMLDDPMLADETERIIATSLINAEAALKKTLQTFQSFFVTIEDEYLRERSNDVEIVVERILRHMVGKEQESLTEIDGKVVIVAHDLSPADILQIDKSKVMGFVTDLGGKTSHSAILARALEIPAVMGLEHATALASFAFGNNDPSVLAECDCFGQV